MIRRLSAALLAASLFTVSASARQDAPPAGEPDPQQAMMQEYVEANSPGEHHALLKNLIGEWTVLTKAWMDPSAEPMEMTGKVTKSWTLDGRFIREDLTGENPLGVYSGVGYLGYDNATKQYQGVWLSSMTTGMIHYTGAADEGGASLTCTGKEADAMTGQTLDFKMTLTLDDANSHTLTFWYVIPGAGEVKAFEMIHTRVQ